MKEELAIILVGLMLLPVIVLAKKGNDLGGSTQPTQTCQEYCQNQTHIACVGEWKISGKYPNCKCEFKCNAKNNSDDNNKPRGPWNAILKNNLLCIVNITNDTKELLLRQKKGKFEAWRFNLTDFSFDHYVAFPISWYKPKVIEKKVNSTQWQLVNITVEDPRVVQCNITAGMYIVQA